MADEVHETVIKRFAVEDSQALGALSGLSSHLSMVGGMVQRITGLFNPLNVAMAGLAGGLSFHGIMKAGSEFENLQIGLAQTMQFMGQGGKTFQDSMDKSSTLMKKIVADAGPLPGNAMDYAEAMQLAGTTVGKATGDFGKSYELIKKSTAVGISLGGSAALTAIELNRMLDANHGMMHSFGDFNQRLLVAMRQLPGMAHLTTQEFNRFSLDKRLKTVTAAMSQFDDMVNAASNSWTAVSGAIEATSSLLLKSASAPLYDAVKKELLALNAAIIDADGKFTPLGNKIVYTAQEFGMRMVASFERFWPLVENFGSVLYDKVVLVWDKVNPYVARFGDLMEKALADPNKTIDKLVHLAELYAAFKGVQLGFAGAAGAMNMSSKVAGAYGGAMGGGGGVSAGGLAIALVKSGWKQIVEVGTDALMSLAGGATVMGTTFVGVAGVAVGLGAALAAGAATFAVVDQAMKLYAITHNDVNDAMTQASTSVHDSIMGFANVMDDGSTAGDALAAAARGAAGALSQISSLLGILPKLHGDVDVGLAKQEANFHDQGQAIGDFYLKQLSLNTINAVKAPPVPATPGGRGGGGRAVQDFRFSRFEIQQRFQEGFNPDQIAVAFARDVGKVGEKRLNSGYEPSFTGR